MSQAGSSELSSVKTYLLVGWIFAILILLSWVIGFLFYFVYFLIVLGLMGPFGSIYVGIGLVYGVLFLILAVPTILVFRRIGRMRNAAERGDIQRLKQLNSTGWAVVALIFAGVIPGIMLLIAIGPINALGTQATGGGGGGIQTDSLDRLGKLKALLDSGAITQAEYDSQKDAILHPGRPQPSGVEEELRKLKALFDSGAITQTEYDEQKRKILSRM